MTLGAKAKAKVKDSSVKINSKQESQSYDHKMYMHRENLANINVSKRSSVTFAMPVKQSKAKNEV